MKAIITRSTGARDMPITGDMVMSLIMLIMGAMARDLIMLITGNMVMSLIMLISGAMARDLNTVEMPRAARHTTHITGWRARPRITVSKGARASAARPAALMGLRRAAPLHCQSLGAKGGAACHTTPSSGAEGNLKRFAGGRSAVRTRGVCR